MRETNMPINQTFTVIWSKKISSKALFSIVLPEQIIIDMAGRTKEAIINELLDILAAQGKLLNRNTALKDLLEREQTMSTGIPNGIAIPHAKTSGVQEMSVALGIKKSGLDFDSAIDDKTRIIILALAPPEKAKSLYQFLLVITALLNNDTVRSELLTAKSPTEVIELLHKYK
jgi:mannitol/fructose-specific phosphotransferase system IIA component (Ntr-type)